MKLKRAYDPPARDDGRRILVERLWPRGMKKESLVADAWVKDVAPSAELRTWFGHREERWDEFRRRYREELSANEAAWKPLLRAAEGGTVTLLYSTHDTAHSGALVLRDYLAERKARRPSAPRRPRSSLSSRSRRTKTSRARRHG